MKKKTIALSAAAALAAIPAAAVSIGAISNLHPPVKPEEGKIRVACVGDSITYGFLVAGQPFNNYPAQLEKLLQGEPPLPLVGPISRNRSLRRASPTHRTSSC